tara:strand:- start:14028 stop:15065 length:1038 start_codon:yes stop_codon:yes gene_type:complete
MLRTEQIKEIREFLEKAKKPLFLFDDDPDGLSSYLLLKKHYDRGVGVCVKASPKSEEVYYKSFSYHRPDLIVLLDRPTLSQETIDKIKVPIVWIDHHQPVEREGVNYYNPMLGSKPDNRPTSYWAYRVVMDNEWIAVVGIIGDWHVPDKNVLKKFEYKKLIKGAKTPPELMFDTIYGNLVKIFSFAMKGTTQSTKECIDALLKIESPIEILEQTTAKGKLVYKKYEKTNKDYQKLVDDALSEKEKNKVFVYTYPGTKNSFTGNLSNELLHRLKNEVIIIGREKDGEVRMSLRSKGKDILPVLNKALEQVEGYGGGHAKACGAAVKMSDLPQFIEIIKKEYKKAKK